MAGAAAYSAFAKAAPYACSISTSTLKGIVSDLFAQLIVERRSRPQWRRTLAFTIFGATYLGAFAQYKYATLYTTLFGAAKTAPVIALKLLADMVISAPLIYFPLYYMFKGVIFGSGAREELRNYFSPHGAGMLKRYWIVWLPSLSAMWMVIPQHLRVPFLCSISLAWQVALSTLSYVPSAQGCEAKAEPKHAAGPRQHFDVVMSERDDLFDYIALRRCARRRGVLRLVLRD